MKKVGRMVGRDGRNTNKGVGGTKESCPVNIQQVKYEY